MPLVNRKFGARLRSTRNIADAHFNLAVIYAKQRTPNVELAKYHYKKALDLGAPPDPNSMRC